MKSMCHDVRRNSPSVAVRTPASRWRATASRIAVSSASRNPASSRSPARCRARASSSAGGRSRLPTWSARNGGSVRTAMSRSVLALGSAAGLPDAYPVDVHVLRELSVLDLGELVVGGQQAQDEVLGNLGDAAADAPGLLAVDAEDQRSRRPLHGEHVEVLPPAVAGAVEEHVRDRGAGLDDAASLVAVDVAEEAAALGLRPEELGDVDLVAGTPWVHPADRLHPEAAVLAAQPWELDASGGDAVPEGEAVVGADVAVEPVGVPAGDLPVLERRAQGVPARVLHHAEPQGAAADPGRLGASPGAPAQALGLVGPSAVLPLLRQRAARKPVGPGRGEPALGAGLVAGDCREAAEGGGPDPVGQRPAVPARRGGELGTAVPVLAGPGHRLPGGTALYLEPHLPAGGDRLDGGGEGRLRVIGTGHATTRLDDLGQRHEAGHLLGVPACRLTGGGFAGCVGGRAGCRHEQQGQGADGEGATCGHGDILAWLGMWRTPGWTSSQALGRL